MELKFRARLARLRPTRRLLLWSLLGTGSVGALGLAVLLALPLPDRLSAEPSTVVTYRDGSPAYVFLAPDDRYRVAVAPGDVDPEYLEALLRFEDKRFYRHPGVDLIAIVRSAGLNLRHRRVLSGASTITMQLVRLLEPRPRTLRSKLIESIRAVQLELRMSKEEVLSAYLTFAPFGGNLEGVEAASQAYFGHGAGQLSAEEIAILLAIPQKPSRRTPSAENEARLRRAQIEIGEWLLAEGVLLDGGDPAEVSRALRQTPVPSGRRPMPREAPHLAFWARQSLPGRSRIHTTLDRELQRLAEEVVGADRERYRLLGIDNAAAVLIDHASGELRAAVGGFDFWSPTSGSQIPAFATPRSPGSALKPFIYALAIDRGLALPERVVADIPSSWGAYAPANYDGRFAGLVPLEAALSRSLNIPFVRLLGTVGVETFLETLRRGGLRHLDPRPGHYGLSAAIGAVEVAPVELASLYGALGNRGTAMPLRWHRDQVVESPRVLLSPGATYLTSRALSRRDRPDFPERRRFRGVSSRVRWKTGTSYGHRDAWAAGFADRYAAAVWLGNLNNRSSADLVGADAAGPLLFDLLEGSETGWASLAPTPTPVDLTWVELCSESGYLPSAACPRTEEALALRQRIPTTKCPFHRLVDVDLESGLALLPGCRSGRSYATQSVLVWPTSVRRWLSVRHRRLPRAPTLDPSCRAPSEATPPEIVSPPPGQTLVLLPGMPTERQELPLQAEVTGAPRDLSWFLDGEYLGEASSDETIWWEPKPGRHSIVVVDASGSSSRRQLVVRQSL